jgi:hypothetical protein
MDAGRCVDFDHPYNLLKDENIFLTNLVNESSSSQLKEIAKENFEEMKTE